MSLRHVILVTAGLVMVVSSGGQAAAQGKRVAFLAANGNYQELIDLKNPALDAGRLADVLAKNGFEVFSCDGAKPGCFDTTGEALAKGLAAFGDKAKDADLAFVFYAGHGMESGGVNVVAPIDAKVDCATHQLAGGVPVDALLAAIAPAKQKVVVLDACRDNPMGKICPPLKEAPALSFAKFEIPAAGNFLLVTSTKPGQKAKDGLPGAHSPFAAALFEALDLAPAVYFDQVFDQVAKTVITKTGEQGFTQIPEMLIRGGKPEACLAGQSCAADPKAAALAAEVEQLKKDRARDQELAALVLPSVEAAGLGGKPLSEEERKRLAEALLDAGRSIAARSDAKSEEALKRWKDGDTGAAAKLFEEDLAALDAEETAEAKRAAERAAERNKKKAATLRRLAALARLDNVAKAADLYRQAAEAEPGNAETWDTYARAAQEAGHTDEAKGAFERAANTARDAGDVSLRFWATLGLGDIARDQGNLDSARRLYETAAAMADEAAKAQPTNAGWQRDLSVFLNKVGDVLVSQGNLPEALTSYRDSLAIRDRLAKADPANAQWQRDLSLSYNNVGDVLVDQGHLAEALTSYRDSLAIRDRLAKADPANAQWQRDLSVSLNKVGDVLVSQGNLPEALTSYRDSLAIADRLAKADPANAQWQRDLSVSYDRVADVLVAQGHLPEALASYRDSLAIFKRLAKADPNNAQWQRDLSVSYQKVGDVLVAQGHLPEALAPYRDSLAIADRLAQADAANAGWQADLAASHGKLGQLHKRLGDKAEALRLFKAGRAIVEPLAKESGHQLWLGYLKSFDADIKALEGK